jgi:predicted N-acyltransferase
LKRICNFITTVKKRKTNSRTRKTPSGFGISVFDSIDAVPEEEWNKVVPENRELMRHPYLRAIRNSSKEDEESRYVLIYNHAKIPVAAAVFNILLLTGEDYGALKNEKNKFKTLKNTLKDKARFRMLICGHTHISGDHGFIYSSGISPQDAYHALADACNRLKNSESLCGEINLQLIKDFYETEFTASEYLKVFNYRQFKVDPNMILKIRAGWNSFDAYLDNMNSKYRKKAITAIKQGYGLERRKLTAEEIKSNFEIIQSLYFNVSSKARVRINHYDASYFIQLKLELKEKFEFTAYYLEGEMAGFSTRIFWDAHCEGHAIGINYDLNAQYAIYQNILYDHVRVAIANKNDNVILGRTALEMKSNIGAEPVEMCCYLRHPGSFLNRAINPVLGYIKKTQWIQRRPFKD